MIASTANFQAALAAFRNGILSAIVTIDGYGKVFTNQATGVANQVPWLKDFDDCSTSINDLDGGADQMSLSFTVMDRLGLVTADFPSFTFEGKKVTVQLGLPGLAQTDYVTLFTGFIETVASTNANADYYFTCVDISAQLASVIYPVGDNGQPIGGNNIKTLLAHPLDLLLNILGSQVGLNQIADPDGVDGKWSVDASVIYSPTGGVVSGGKWTYTGTGAASGFHLPQSATFPVTPGQKVIFSAYCDASKVTLGTATWQLYDPTIVTNYAALFFGVGVNGQLSTTFIVPPGVTQMKCICDTSNCTVTAGQPVIWSNPQLSVVGKDQYYDITKIRAYRDGIFAGLQFQFHLTQSVAAADFIKQQILKPLGGYLWVNSLGAISVNFFYPLSTPTAVATLGPAVFDMIPEAEQLDIINTVQFQFDKDDATSNSSGNYLAVDTELYQTSITKYGTQFGEQVIQADGLRSGFQGFFIARMVSRMVFGRYGLKNLKFDQNASDSLWSTCLLEPGDVVALTHPSIPDRVAGVMGITGKLFEIINRTFKFSSGLMNFTMIDASYLSNIGLFKISPDGTSNYNLLNAPSDFGNAAWTNGGATVTSNTDTAPDGTLTADTLTDSSAVAFSSVAQNATIPADGQTYEVVLFLKKTTAATNTVGLNVNNQSGNVSFPRINTNSGIATGTGVTVTSVGAFWRVSVILTNPGTWTTLGFSFQPATGTNSGNNPGTPDAASTTGSCVASGACIRKIADNNTFMYLCNDLDQYSDGDAAHVLG